MNRLLHFLNTTIGRKLLVALSGIFLVLFVIGHVVGNLTVYIGPSALNGYAHWLQENPLLWFIRLGMLIIVSVHIALAIKVSLESIGARKQGYQSGRTLYQLLVDHRMMISGLLLFLFIIGHIAHLTLGVGVGEYFNRVDERGFVDVYARVVIGFQNPFIAWGYIVSMVLLAVHLKHSVRALFQTLGFFHENYFSFYELLSWAIAIFVFIGLCSIPVAVQFGLIEAAQSTLNALFPWANPGSAA